MARPTLQCETTNMTAPATFPLIFSNAEDGVSGYVSEATNGKGYNVTLRDDDSGEFVPSAICHIASLDVAIETARKAAGLIPSGVPNYMTIA